MFSHPHPAPFLMPPIDISPSPIPKLGQTRCYWALLSAELDFLYVDPVLTFHLGPQADAIIGKKLLDFVHPDEHASAQQDLGKVLESRTLHGSVTRVRYSRLGKTRARLGYTGVHEKFADEDKVSFDEDYMACDLVINWAAEGLVLCFIHAVVDMSPQDNDELHRTHWTNWCGTPRMNLEHGAKLYHALFHIAPHAAQGAPPPTRVFQVLHNSTDRPTLFSWPAEGYIPADYGRLATDVQIGGANGSDAKTSCTRRYKAQQVLNSADGSVRDVESIFIPHGHIIFACHKATPQRPRGHPNSYPLYPTPAQFYDNPAHTHAPAPYYPPMSVPSQMDTYPAASGHTYAYHPHHAQSQSQQPHQQSSPLPSSGASSPGASRSNSASAPSPYPPTQWTAPTQQQPQQPAYIDHPSPNGQRYAAPGPGPGPYIDEVPPPRQRAGRLTPETGVVVGGSTRETYQGAGRAGGNPPVGVSRCAACKSTSSPEWRKGPSGRKDLCNACGLRYSRARAKKEGVAVQRRRKEGGKSLAQGQPQTPGQTPAQAQAKRRAYAHNGYADFALEEQQQQHMGEESTPSPSPPHEYHPHAASSSGMYAPYSGQSTMYMGGATQHPYTQHPNGYPSPGAAPGTSPSGASATLSSASTSSYERTGMPPDTRALENQHRQQQQQQQQHHHHHAHHVPP